MASTLRLDGELQDKLRLWRAFTGESANHLAARLLRAFFASEGDALIADAMTARAVRQHGAALTELAGR